MPSWIDTILVAGGTTLFTGLFITPRLEWRTQRLRVVRENRDRFSRSVLTILAACSRLNAIQVPAELEAKRPELARRVHAERERWVDQVDEATRWMVDNIETFSLSYPSRRLQRICQEFASQARAVVLSERSVEKKAERLTALASPVQNLFFARCWNVAAKLRGFAEFDRAVATLAEDVPDASS